MNSVVNGMQHIGIGTADLVTTWKWYYQKFGFDIPLFDSIAEAPLMQRYTNDKVVNKRAAMVYNLQGGPAIEMIELRSEKTIEPTTEFELGDLGIFAAKIKVPSHSFDKAVARFISEGDGVMGRVEKQPNGKKSFLLKDPNDLYFQVVEGDEYFSKGPHDTAGIGGCIIGCSDIERSKQFYSAVGYSEVEYEFEGKFEDFKGLPGGNRTFKRCLLKQVQPASGGFARFFGENTIELVQVMDREPQKILENRIWGDTGFVHLGFDVKGMQGIEERLTEMDHPFTCDSSNNLHMGQTRVHCTYVEDPDGALIELIEIYKFPVIEKWGIYLNVEKRSPMKPYPDWVIKLAKLTRIKSDYWEKNPK